MIKLSENLIINTGNNEFNYKAVTDLDQVIKDIQFLEVHSYGKVFYVGEHKLCEYKDICLNEPFQQKLNSFKQINLAINKFEIRLNKKFGDFTDNDWKAIDDQLKKYQGKLHLKITMHGICGGGREK